MRKTERKRNSSIKRDYYTIVAGLVFIGTMIFRIPLEHMIGDKGLACYGTVYEIYFVLGGMISYGLSETVSALVRYRVKREQYKNAQKVLGSAVMLGGVLGAILGVLLGLLGHVISNRIFHIPLAGLSVCVMAPAIFFFILTGVFRGYFQGNGSRIPAMHSQLLQIVILFAGGLIFCRIFSDYGSKVSALLQNEDYTSAYGAMGATLGLLISSVLGFLHVLILYLVFKENIKRQMSREMPKNQDSRFHIFHMLVGTGGMYFLYWFFFHGQTLSGELILMRFAPNPGEILASWGAYYGKVIPVIGSICGILSLICLPEVRKIVALQEREEYRLAREKLGALIHQSAVFGVPSAVFLAVFAESILDILFGGNNAKTAVWLQFGSILIIFFLFSMIFMEFLLRSRKLVYVTGIGAGAFLLQAVLLVLMVKSESLGMLALIVAGIVFYTVTVVGGFILSGRKLQYRKEWIRGIILTILSAALSGIIAMLLNKALASLMGELLSFFLCLIVAIVVYLVILVVTRAFTAEELEKMPCGFLLIWLAGMFQIRE